MYEGLAAGSVSDNELIFAYSWGTILFRRCNIHLRGLALC